MMKKNNKRNLKIYLTIGNVQSAVHQRQNLVKCFKLGEKMTKYENLICGYIFDEDKEGIKFKDLPEDYECPGCGSPKSEFKKTD